jgi:hypothetical protein
LYLFWLLDVERSRTRELLQREEVCAPSAPPPTAAVAPAPALTPQPAPPSEPTTTSVSAAVSGTPRMWPAPTQTPEQRDYWTRKRYRTVLRELALSDDDISALVPLLNKQDQRASKPGPEVAACARWQRTRS